MPNPAVLFSLLPKNDRAKRALHCPENAQFLSSLADGEAVLDIGHVPSASGDQNTLATLGRAGDILIEGSLMAKIQCSFEMNRETGVVMFYDRSHKRSSMVGGQNVVQFEDDRPRRIVIRPQVKTFIGMGGEDRDLVQFQVVWRANADAVADAVKQHEAAQLPPLPAANALAQTADYESDTVGPSRIGTRIHTKDSRKQKMRWMYMSKEAIGEGTFAKVHEGLDHDSGRLMAVKILSYSPDVGDGAWAKLKNEVEILDKLKHEHIIDYIFSQGWEVHRAEIFMGLKDGTLAHLIPAESTDAPDDIAASVCYQMLRALDYLDFQGVVHCGLKPENILYTAQNDQWHFQLSDFGLSKRQDSGGMVTVQGGTKLYQAPEIFSRKQCAKSDVWALFVTFMWIFNTDGLRQLARDSSGEAVGLEIIWEMVARAAALPQYAKVRAMARPDPDTRASAAQMLVALGQEAGLTTPRRHVRPIVTPPESTPVAQVDAPVPEPDANSPELHVPPYHLRSHDPARRPAQLSHPRPRQAQDQPGRTSPYPSPRPRSAREPTPEPATGLEPGEAAVARQQMYRMPGTYGDWFE